MSDFKLDTGGVVMITNALDGYVQGVIWSDLIPFCQGAVDAAFAEPIHGDNRTRWGNHYNFRDLAPATLERIMADCERAVADLPDDVRDLRRATNAEAGSHWWRLRQIKGLAIYAPLTLYLADDGLIHIKDA